MSKIICDVCGTSYPETSEQCPICGTVRPDDISGVLPNYDSEEKKGYTYVKGGRFSKANVKKRNMAQKATEDVDVDYNQQQYSRPQYSEPEEVEEEYEKTNKGLIITAILLFVAIILLAVYIGIQFMGNSSDTPVDEPTITTTEPTVTEPSTVETTLPLEVPCESLHLPDNTSNMIRLSAVGDVYLINAIVEPADTTDEITYYSEDELIATVSDDGKIQAVGPGETSVWVSCGTESMICYVICDIELPTEETTAPTEETTAPTEDDPGYTIDDLKIKTFRDSGEITIAINELAKIYVGNIPLEEVKIYSADTNIVKVEGASVVGVGRGTAKVYVEYGDLQQICTVHVTGNQYTGQSGSGHVDDPDAP